MGLGDSLLPLPLIDTDDETRDAKDSSGSEEVRVPSWVSLSYLHCHQCVLLASSFCASYCIVIRMYSCIALL